MGVLDWLFKKSNFHRVEDTFALKREMLWEGIRKTLQSPSQENRSTWLIAHFINTFTEVQDRLEEWGLEYEIVSSKLNANQLDRTGLITNQAFPAPLKLILSELVPAPQDSTSLLPRDPEKRVAMIMLERHPQIRHDQRLEAFARSVPLLVEFGYFLALDDPTVLLSFDKKNVQILQQLGLKNQLVSSNMVSRRLEIVLKRVSNDFSGDTPSDSAAQWLLINSQ